MEQEIETLRKLRNDPNLKLYCRFGYVYTSIFQHLETYFYYDKLRKIGLKPMDALMTTAEDMKVSERTVGRIIKRFK